jgi:hypothetical protein
MRRQGLHEHEYRMPNCLVGFRAEEEKGRGDFTSLFRRRNFHGEMSGSEQTAILTVCQAMALTRTRLTTS